MPQTPVPRISMARPLSFPEMTGGQVETNTGAAHVHGFLTTSPNAIVGPIHPKAMPVILTTDEEEVSGIATVILTWL